MLYIGTAADLPLTSTQDLTVQEVDGSHGHVRQWFSQPVVRFVGAHTGCSCGFPSVSAESSIDYYEGMPLESDDCEAEPRSVRALIELLRHAGTTTDYCELYPVWDGEESQRPKGRIEWQLQQLNPERFFFNERFMHVVRAR